MFRIYFSIVFTLLMLSGLSYEFYQNEYLKIRDKNKEISKPEITADGESASSENKINNDDLAGKINEENSSRNKNNKTNTKTTISNNIEKTGYRNLSVEELAAAEKVKNIGSYPELTQEDINKIIQQKMIDETYTKIAQSKAKIVQYEERISEIENLILSEELDQETINSYYGEINQLDSLIYEEQVNIFDLETYLKIVQ